MGWGVSHSLSCPTAPARDRVGQGAAWADPALGISHLPGASGGQGWDRSLGCPGPPFHASWRNGAGKAALSLSQPWAGSHIPRGVCSQSPHSPLRDRLRTPGNVFLLLRGEEGKALLMPVWYLLVIHAISKGEWEDWKVIINRAESM